MLSGPLFVIGTFERSFTSRDACSCVSYMLFRVDAAEGIVAGLGAREGALSSGTKRLFLSLIRFYVGGVAFFKRFECLSSSGGSSRASLEPESRVPK